MLHRIKGLFQKTSNSKVENKSNFHGRLTAENATQERIQQNQHGRSMVEMLGVLVIIGVLSIGALAGYNYAMDKYRASETINDINARGVDLIIQASRNIPLNLDEWGNKSSAGYTFGAPELVDGFVKLPISGLPKRVCEMVAEDLSSKFDIDVGADRYAGDTSLCGENNTVTVYFEGNGDGVICTPACASGEVCEHGVCIDEESQPVSGDYFLCETNANCPECHECKKGYGAHSYCEKQTGTPCDLGTCYNGMCIANDCTTNDDCGANEFCAAVAEGFGACSVSKWACQKINVIKKNIVLNGVTENIYVSSREMHWNSLENWCRKLGKNPVSSDDILVRVENPQDKPEATELYNGLTPFGQELKRIFSGSYALWTDSSCTAVSLSTENISSGFALALCR